MSDENRGDLTGQASSSKSPESSGSSMSDSDDMLAYLQVYVEETEEELDALANVLLELENDSHNRSHIDESFRLVHSMKGSSGMMGLTTMSELAHRWEDLLERHRSSDMPLQQQHIDVMLQCVDAFRAFVQRLRAEGALQDAQSDETAPLVAQLEQLLASASDQQTPDTRTAGDSTAKAATSAQFTSLKLAIRFEPSLQLPDLKARLIVNRLSSLAEVLSVHPELEDAEAVEQSCRITVALLTQRDAEEIRSVADLEGVQSIEFEPVSGNQTRAIQESELPLGPAAASSDDDDFTLHEVSQDQFAEPAAAPESEPATVSAADSSASPSSPQQVAESVRVDIERLDQLMNLTGELIVNRERFEQLTRNLAPTMKKKASAARLYELSERLETLISSRCEAVPSSAAGRASSRHDQQLRRELDLLRHYAMHWHDASEQFSKVTHAVDQLTRISDDLQRSVMETRMVPLAPLFNRFKRVVRDLSSGTGKQVRLSIRGEKTELDKRMIDELADPLIHLVRNAIDHGLETPAQRRSARKGETGTILLQASHRGNSVYIVIQDDGRGIDIQRVRQRIVDRGLASAAAAAGFSDQDVLEFIWRPGFSTAESVTDISGRGVGMDIVRNRITDLRGAIDIESSPQVGTTFTIRLPLTLAIIPSLLVRLRGSLFSVPLEEVVEIAEAAAAQIVTVQGRRAVEIRGEFLPLLSLEDVFASGSGSRKKGSQESPRHSGKATQLVVLNVNGKPVALAIDSPVGVSELVVKSLADNFRPVPGLSGASILGDGDICLMLDSATVVELARQRFSPPPPSAAPA